MMDDTTVTQHVCKGTFIHVHTVILNTPIDVSAPLPNAPVDQPLTDAIGHVYR
jgi:hypothetical protein